MVLSPVFTVLDDYNLNKLEYGFGFEHHGITNTYSQ